MTLPLRRKRQTILPLAWTLLSLAGNAHAAEPAGPVLARPGTSARTSTQVEPAFRFTREEWNKIRKVQLGDDVRLKRGPGVPVPDADQFFYRIVKEPPSGAELFAIRSEDSALRVLEAEFKRKDPGQAFRLPSPRDDFNVADMPTLGPSWFQNQKTGRSRDEKSDRRGEMRVVRQAGEFPVGSNIEVAILNESVGSKDMQVAVTIELGNPTNQFGVVFRAQDPTALVDQGAAEEAIDQITANKFYYAVFTAASVEVGRSDKGNRTRLKSARIEPKNQFRVSVTMFGNSIRVHRDGAEILALDDSAISAGTYSGVVGVVARGQAVRFDDFEALRYGGQYEPRAFTPTLSQFPGPNVHYSPLYFEQVPLERYGHHAGNLYEPWFAAIGFYLDTAMLPYSVVHHCPWECLSNDGYFKPGDIVLPMKILLPTCDPKALVAEATVLALGFSLIP